MRKWGKRGSPRNAGDNTWPSPFASVWPIPPRESMATSAPTQRPRPSNTYSQTSLTSLRFSLHQRATREDENNLLRNRTRWVCQRIDDNKLMLVVGPSLENDSKMCFKIKECLSWLSRKKMRFSCIPYKCAVCYSPSLLAVLEIIPFPVFRLLRELSLRLNIKGYTWLLVILRKGLRSLYTAILKSSCMLLLQVSKQRAIMDLTRVCQHTGLCVLLLLFFISHIRTAQLDIGSSSNQMADDVAIGIENSLSMAFDLLYWTLVCEMIVLVGQVRHLLLTSCLWSQIFLQYCIIGSNLVLLVKTETTKKNTGLTFYYLYWMQ